MPLSHELRVKIRQATEEFEAIERDKNNRETYRLACQIVDKLGPEESIAKLELIGEERLRQIVGWLKGV